MGNMSNLLPITNINLLVIGISGEKIDLNLFVSAIPFYLLILTLFQRLLSCRSILSTHYINPIYLSITDQYWYFNNLWYI